MAQYVYQPLNESNSEIRLITLLPSSDRDSEVICDLKIVRLTKEDAPHYIALSYTWGSAESPTRLRVSSENDHSIDITRNLAEALPYLRDRVSPRTLWIDSIAIDQKDLAERSQQVQRMADIYSLAAGVIVWLGKDDASSKVAMETCMILGTKVEVEFNGEKKLRSLTDEPDDAHWVDMRQPLPYDFATWQAILELLRRPWFHRLWIWQEISLAKSNAVIMCGTDTMLWKRLRTLLDCIAYKRCLIPFVGDETEDASVFVSNAYNLARGMEVSLLDLLAYMRHAQCHDPRDRVYGILGLSFKIGTGTDLRPDYNKPIVDVYMDLMMASMQKLRRLDLLSLCRYEETRGNWPSWIPYLMDLEKGRRIPSFASGKSCCEVELLENRILRMTGIRLSQITMVDEFDASYENAESAIQRWANRLDMASDYVDGKSLAEALCLAICGGDLADYHVPTLKSHPGLASSVAVLKNTVQPEFSTAVTDWDKKDFFHHVFTMCRDRALFTTSSNHIGICPKDTRKGDQICVLLGCDVPVAIRSDSNGHYKIIGDSYVPGFSSNEGFLGPLPKGYREVQHYNAQSGMDYWVYLDLETGKIQVGDPRLGDELPSGWQRVTDIEGQFWEEYVHDGASSTRTYLDPRLTKPELLKRGVPLEDIEFS